MALYVAGLLGVVVFPKMKTQLMCCIDGCSRERGVGVLCLFHSTHNMKDFIAASKRCVILLNEAFRNFSKKMNEWASDPKTKKMLSDMSKGIKKNNKVIFEYSKKEKGGFVMINNTLIGPRKRLNLVLPKNVELDFRKLSKKEGKSLSFKLVEVMIDAVKKSKNGK